MKPRRIGIFLPSLSHGGAERVASTLANNWAEDPNCEVHMITFAGLEPFYKISPRVVAFEAALLPSGPFALAKLFLLALRVRKYVIRHELEAVLSFMDKYNVFILICLAFSGVRVTVSDRSNPKRKRARLLSLLKRLTYPYAASVIAQTSLAARYILEQTGVRGIEVIPNPVRQVQKIADESERKKIVLNVGRLVALKGQAGLIRAFSRDMADDWSLVIVGEGPMRHELETLTKALGLQDRVHLPGATRNIDAWYQRASIFVLSSELEGFPNALVEAMSHGLACVSFDCDTGPSEIIVNRKSGLLVSPGDEEELARCMRSLMDDRQGREAMGRAAKIRAEDFSEIDICQRYLACCLGPA